MNQYAYPVSGSHNNKTGGRQKLTGSSDGMRNLYFTLDRLANSDVPVFLIGESGTGKELCATMLHDKSYRRDNPFIAVNCAAIPLDIFESQFFGHLKGTFTGATCDSIGYARAADGGTLFLDEIAELSLPMQSKLLRFLQTSQVMPVGSTKAYAVSSRIVCATNEDILDLVNRGLFRKDLYYRLSVVPVKLLPLRERGRDIIEIALSLLKRYSAVERKSFRSLSFTAEQALLNYPWPGNVRELENVIRRAIVMHEGCILDKGMLSFNDDFVPPDNHAMAGVGEAVKAPSMVIPLWKVEQEAIEKAIKACEGNIQRAASLLEVSPSTLYRKRQAWKCCTENA